MNSGLGSRRTSCLGFPSGAFENASDFRRYDAVKLLRHSHPNYAGVTENSLTAENVDGGAVDLLRIPREAQWRADAAPRC